jgi:hypothetical protein
MSYNYEHIDHIFYRMRETIPRSNKFYYVIIILKILPLFLLIHTAGYTYAKGSTTISFYKYLSMSFYVQNSLGMENALELVIGLFLFNLLMIIIMIYYIKISGKIQKIDENYGKNSLSYNFSVFSTCLFFKFVLFSQFFYEINSLPVVCLKDSVNFDKIAQYEILPNFTKASLDTLCSGVNLYVFIILSCLNMFIDIGSYYIINSRFFDFNILSTHFWNFYPNLMFTPLFLESLAQIFFIVLLNFSCESFIIGISVYYYLLLLVYMIRFFKRINFYTVETLYVTVIMEVFSILCIIAHLIVISFYYGFNEGPDDINLIFMLFLEFILAFLKYYFFHKNDASYVSNILINPLSQLNEKNIYYVLTYLCTQFRLFSDINTRFNDKTLELFLYDYIVHLKKCDNPACVCKDYLKKAEQLTCTNTLKLALTTVFNFTQTGAVMPVGAVKEEYILNKFFNVLSNNLNSTIKHTNNINFLQIKDDQKQKIIYTLRIRLINAVRKLIFYRLQNLLAGLDTAYSNNFKLLTKTFIRINIYSLEIVCNRTYYKTLFLFHEYLSEQFLRVGKMYRWEYIYYFYLKHHGIKEYNAYITYLKSTKKEVTIDFRSILATCLRFYDIEEKLLDAVKIYLDFIVYFERISIDFNKFFNKIKNFKAAYKQLTQYIRFFFKNDKINNLFICSKIILFFKILQFEIPEGLHNKLIVQTHEVDDQNAREYIDSNYFIISSYVEGDFKIKFISHELLVMLEYAEEDLKDKDFHILFPEKMREIHKHLVMSEIKRRTPNNLAMKEIFFVSKKKTSILFDLHYKVLLNLRGEITLLSIINLKKPKSDVKTSFVCVDDSGSILAVNKEFEEFLIISMKMLEYIKIDCEKIILQNYGNRIRSFFKEQENRNSEFYEKFDYEHYLQSLFGEEFEPLKDRNETLYRKKSQKCEFLKEVIRKTRYTRFIDFVVKMRVISNTKIYFIKYQVNSKFSAKSTEPYNTTLSLINAVKISKREMAKLSFYRMEEIYEAKSEITDEKLNDSRDFLNESQSILSSTASILKERNSKKLFRSKKDRFKILPKSRNILILTIFLAVFSIISIIFNIIVLYTEADLRTYDFDLMKLNIDSIILESVIFSLSSDIVSLGLNMDNVTDSNGINYKANLVQSIEMNLVSLVDVVYDLNSLGTKYYNAELYSLMNEYSNNFEYVFENGFVYKKDDNSVVTFKEISGLHDKAFRFYTYFIDNYNPENLSNFKLNLKSQILFQKFKNNLLDNKKAILNSYDLIIYYFLHNMFTEVEAFLSKLRILFDDYSTNYHEGIKLTFYLFTFFEFAIVFIIIIALYIFIVISYEKVKKKIRNLKQKVHTNNVETTYRKIEEYIKFCNTFNIYSLYIIADFELYPRKTESESPVKEKKRRVGETLINNLTPKDKNSILPAANETADFEKTTDKLLNKGDNVFDKLNLSPDKRPSQPDYSPRKSNLKRTSLANDDFKLDEDPLETGGSTNNAIVRPKPKNSILKPLKQMEEEYEESDEGSPKPPTKKISFVGVKKITWTDKNVATYNPEKNTDNFNQPAHTKAFKKLQSKVEKLDHEDLPLILDKPRDIPQTFDPDLRKQNSMASKTSDEVDLKRSSTNSSKKLDFRSSSNVNNQVIDIKDINNRDMKKFQDNKTFKKRSDNKAQLKEDILEEYVENIKHSDKKSRFVLLIFLFIFIILYVTNYVYNLYSFKSFEKMNSISTILLDRFNVINMLVYRYKTSLMTNSTQDDLSQYLQMVDKNIQDIIDIQKNGELYLLPLTNSIEEYFPQTGACAYFSYQFSLKFNSTNSTEFEECMTIGNSINVDGFTTAYNTAFNKMKFFYNDMRRMDVLSEDLLLAKLTDYNFQNIVTEVEYTFSKYNLLLQQYLLEDIQTLKDLFNSYENIFSYCSIFLNVVFSILACIFIIFPIKYVEMIISWLNHKLRKN